MKLGSADVSFTHLRGERITTCNMVVKGKVYQGLARCSHLDHFNRDKGRKVALAGAMSHAKEGLTKRQRKNVWEAYRTMTKVPRW